MMVFIRELLNAEVRRGTQRGSISLDCPVPPSLPLNSQLACMVGEIFFSFLLCVPLRTSAFNFSLLFLLHLTGSQRAREL